jgi:flavin-dependent dehydrogenase
MKTIRIAGAGVSGLTAAIALANKAVPVEVYEIMQFNTWQSVSKGIQTIRNYEARQDILDKFKGMGIRFVKPYPVYSEVRYSPSLKQIEIFSKDRPIFYCLSRNPPNSMMSELFNEAALKNVKFKFGSTVKDPDIIASGPRMRKISVFGYHYEKANCDGSIHIFLDNRYASHGYIGILPYHDGEMTLGSASFSGTEDVLALKQKLDRFIEATPIVKDFLKGAKRAQIISGYEDYETLVTAKAENSILTGEAGGFMDASRGFGLSYAVESGYLAAKSIIENRSYDELWKSSFGEKISRYYLRRKELSRLNNTDYEKIIGEMIQRYGPQVSIEKYADFKSRSLV